MKEIQNERTCLIKNKNKTEQDSFYLTCNTWVFLELNTIAEHVRVAKSLIRLVETFRKLSWSVE